MLKKKLILLSGIILAGLLTLAYADEREMKDYKVQQGDTLWDIAKKELSDPFLWPKVWKENQDISNPDKLMPGQIVRIPLYLLKKEMPQEEPAEAPVVKTEPKKADTQPLPVAPPPPKLKPLVDRNIFISSGYIASIVNEEGKITATPVEKTLLGAPDMIYVETKSAVKPGDRFLILRKGGLVRHPVTKNTLGYLVEVTGIAEIKKSEHGATTAQIVVSYTDVNIGDILDTYVDMTPPVVPKPYRKPDIKGYVVEARNLRLSNTLFDVVYIDKGRKDGIEPGDMLKAVAMGKYPLTNGLVQVIRVMDETSVAVVRKTINSITRGDMLTAAE